MISFFATSNFFVHVLFNKEFRATLKEKLANLLECSKRIQSKVNNRNVNDNLNRSNPIADNAIEMGSTRAEPNIDIQVTN